MIKMIPQGSKGHAKMRTLHSVSAGSQDLWGGFYVDSFSSVEFPLDFWCILLFLCCISAVFLLYSVVFCCIFAVFLLYFCCFSAVFDIGDNDDIHEAGGGRVASERLPLPTFSCEHHFHQVNDYDEYFFPLYDTFIERSCEHRKIATCQQMNVQITAQIWSN